MRLILVGVIAAASLIFAAPAGADKPLIIEDSFTFTDVNPCTELVDEITIEVVVSIHNHKNNNVATIKRTGFTDSGYTMEHSNETQVRNKGGAHFRFNDVWTNDEGSKFTVKGVFVENANKGEVVVDRFTFNCLD
jgi:hypothetical protein